MISYKDTIKAKYYLRQLETYIYNITKANLIDEDTFTTAINSLNSLSSILNKEDLL